MWRLVTLLMKKQNKVSEPVFLQHPNSMSVKFYQEHCISTALVPFIDENHLENNIMFWSNLASAHYSNSTLQLLEALRTPFVSKTSNPSNIPECRPVKNLWTNLKAEVHKGGQEHQIISV
jgi:hypothetical protein